MGCTGAIVGNVFVLNTDGSKLVSVVVVELVPSPSVVVSMDLPVVVGCKIEVKFVFILIPLVAIVVVNEDDEVVIALIGGCVGKVGPLVGCSITTGRRVGDSVGIGLGLVVGLLVGLLVGR